MNRQRLLRQILGGSKNIAFTDFVNLMHGFGFKLSRMGGSHQIFKHPNVKELVNIQNVKGKVKPYQMKQVLSVVERYNLKLEEEN